MSQRTDRDPNTGKRVLRFVATSAVIVAPISFVACGGAKHAPENVNVVERTNVRQEQIEPEAAVPEKTNVDHTAEPHTNVGPEEEPEGGGDKASPE
jgi:hypothetical protein